MRRLAAIVAFALLTPQAARAHGGLPQTQVLLFPGDGRLVIVATFGVLYGDESGGGFGWVCPEAIPGGRAGIAPATVLAPDGALIMATPSGLVRGAPGGCAWAQASAALEGSYVSDVIEDPGGTLIAVQSDAGTENALHASADGTAWAPLGGPLPEGFLPERVRVAPSELSRVYVSGAYAATATTPRRAMIYRSDDRASTFAGHELTLREGERDLLLLDVDPADPDHVVAYVRGDGTDRLVESTDGGTTFSDLDVIEAASGTVHRPFGYARADDGTLYYGNTRSGLSAIDGGATVSIDKYVAVGCLAVRGTELLLCGDGMDDGFSVARAPLPGLETYTPVFEFAQVSGPLDCSPDDGCSDQYGDLLRHLGRDGGVDAGAPDGGPSETDAGSGFDAGHRDDAGPPPDATGRRVGIGGGGGCSAAGSGGASPLVPLLLFILLRRRRGGLGSPCRSCTDSARALLY